jgi:hypothetical protein
MCSLAAIVKYKKGQWQRHPLEISGQAGKEIFLIFFIRYRQPIVCIRLLTIYAPKNFMMWYQLICTSHPSELRRLSVAINRYRHLGRCLRNLLVPYYVQVFREDVSFSL